MKYCPSCEKNKNFECFNKNKARHDGLAPHCKECRKILSKTLQSKKQRKILNLKNKEKRSEKRKKEYKKNKEKILFDLHISYYKHKEKRKNSILIRKYGITLIDYELFLVQQNGKCKICKKENPGKYKYFAVDHCHTTGLVRGLLCSKCNTGLGQFSDSIELLNSAIIYLLEVKKVP